MLRTFISEGPDPQVVVCVNRAEHRMTAEATLEVATTSSTGSAGAPESSGQVRSLTHSTAYGNLRPD